MRLGIYVYIFYIMSRMMVKSLRSELYIYNFNGKRGKFNFIRCII